MSKKERKFDGAEASVEEDVENLQTKKQLKAFLESVRDRMSDGASSPIYSLGSMNHILSLPNIYDILDDENKELARDIWFQITASGLSVTPPPILFESV